MGWDQLSPNWWKCPEFQEIQEMPAKFKEIKGAYLEKERNYAKTNERSELREEGDTDANLCKENWLLK